MLDVVTVSGRFATGKVRHRKVRHKIERFATALEGSPQLISIIGRFATMLELITKHFNVIW